MIKLFLHIGGISFSVCAPKEFSLPDSFLPFVCDAVSAPDFSVTLSQEALAPQAGTLLFRSTARHVWMDKNALVYCHLLADGRELCRAYIAEDFLSARIVLPQNSPISFGAALHFIPFGIAFLPHNGIFFHAATVVLHEKAYVFTAPSGGGKSTHAALWEENLGAKLLNGDRILLREKDGVFYAYGLPVAGSSFIFLNERAPVAAVTLLQKAEENRATRADEKSLAAIMEQMELPLFHPVLADKTLAVISALSQSIPFYTLACRPDAAAAHTIYQQIQKECVL